MILSDHIRIKGYDPNWSEKVFVIRKIRNTVPWTYFIIDFNDQEIAETFYEKKSQKTSQT